MTLGDDTLAKFNNARPQGRPYLDVKTSKAAIVIPTGTVLAGTSMHTYLHGFTGGVDLHVPQEPTWTRKTFYMSCVPVYMYSFVTPAHMHAPVHVPTYPGNILFLNPTRCCAGPAGSA